MFGIILVLLTAMFAASHDSFINASSKKGDEYVTALAMTLFSFPVVLLALIWTGIPQTNIYFWIAVGVKTPLMSCAGIFRAKAHKRADQSLIVPLLCFTPVFVLMFAPIVLNQHIKPLGMVGVLIIVIGVYVMRITESKKGFFGPVIIIFREAGARYMLLVAFLWSITTILDGVGVINAGGMKNDIFLSFRAGAFWLLCTQGLSAIITGVIVFCRRNNKAEINFKKLIPIGLSNSLQELAQMCAMGLIAAVYVNSIKRLSIILTVLIGHYYFKEEGLKERLPGAVIMVVGFILITISK
jgi:uncharacterized membrane protein